METLDPPVDAASPPAAQSRILPANLLFLVTLGLVLTLGSAVQSWRMWPGLAVTELLCILLPAWLFARKTGSPAEALRLHWPGVAPCAFGFVTGACAFPLAGISALLGSKILGYQIPLPDWALPKGLGAILVYVLASVMLAPLCEEMVFRGYILRAYERAGWRPAAAILAVSGLFTAWHVSPAHMTAVVVFAIPLSYIAWRTGSVWPSVAGHMGANGTAAALVIARARIVEHEPGPRPLIAAGIAAAVALAVCLGGIAGRPRPAGWPPIERGPLFRSWWPLFAAGVIVSAVAGAEIVTNRGASHPQPMLQVKAPWSAPFNLVYEISANGGHIGDADYHLIDQGPAGWLLFGTVTFRAPNGMTGDLTGRTSTAAKCYDLRVEQRFPERKEQSMCPVRISLLTLLLSSLLMGANADPFIGRWKLNWAKSQSERAAPKSVIRKYTKFRDGFKISEDWRGQDGEIRKFVYTAKYDGQDYPISHEGGGTITFTRHDVNVAEGVAKTGEDGTCTFKQTISQDRKTLIIETTRVDSSGRERKDVLAYEKMK